MVIILIFALSAIVGAILLINIIKGKSQNTLLAIGHGSLAVMGMFFLGLELYKGRVELAVVFAVFLLGAFGGFYLSYSDFVNKKRPKSILVMHVCAGLSGFLILILILFSMS